MTPPGLVGGTSAPSALGARRDTERMWGHLGDFGCSEVLFGTWISPHRREEQGLLFGVL